MEKSRDVPIVLAQYRIGKTLGIGAFGKVKCTYSDLYELIVRVFKSLLFHLRNQWLIILLQDKKWQ
jgi:hypothetical protein